MEAGVNGIFLVVTLGEASTLKHEEKEILIKTTLSITDQKSPVIINIAEQQTEGAVAVTQNVESTGANGLMLLPPMGYKATGFGDRTLYLRRLPKAQKKVIGCVFRTVAVTLLDVL